MLILRSRRLVHALIATGVFLILAGLYWLDTAGRGLGILERGEYAFRDMLSREGRLNRPDSRLFFLARDSDAMVTSDIAEFSKDDVPPEDYRALKLMTERWPWSYEVWALLCERLLTGGARAVVLDIVFWQSDRGDAEFRRVLEKFPGQIILASDLGQGQQVKAWRLPSRGILPKASPDHPAIGYDTLFRDFDGKIRQARFQTTLEQLDGGLEPHGEGFGVAPTSLALRAATKLGPVKLSQPFQFHRFRYTGPPGTFRVFSMFNVFAYWEPNCLNGKLFQDKVVMVGDSGSILHDVAETPFGTMPGPEIHLNAINALLHHEFLHELPPWAGALLMVLAVVAAWALTVLVKKKLVLAAAFVFLAAGYICSVILAYNHIGTIVLAVPPVLAFFGAGFGSFVYDFTNETLEKLRIRRTLEAYVSKDVVREVLDNPESYLSKLGGERESVALIMTDLRGFTTMSEEMDSTQLVAQLNEYLSVMVDDIFSRRGSVDKFVGDAILAVWGHVKSEGPAHDATLAVEAALLMRESLKRLNADWQKRGLRTFEMGCGVNFGEVIFGNIGSARKMEPTVIGDAVNTTSRLEGLTKDYGRDLLLGETAADLIDDTYRLQFVDRVTMKGKTKPVRIYSVVSRLDEPVEPQMTAYLAAYELAQTSYSAGRFQEAKALFENCLQYRPDDLLVRMYIERCTTLLERPSDEVWTGVHVAEHK